MSRARLVLCVLVPFAAGYYLSYLFRSINALIAGDLQAELGLSAADLGALTSAYFLVFAAVLLPCGVLLDRYGPRLIDSALRGSDADCRLGASPSNMALATCSSS